MNTIVDKLLDVDKEARKILDEAQQYYENTMIETEAEKQQIKEQLTQRAEKHILDAQHADQNDANERIRVIRAQNDALATEMKQTFATYQQQWQDELFARCTSGA